MSFKIFSGTYKSSKDIKIETKNIYNSKDYLKRNKKKIKKQIKEDGIINYNYDFNSVIATNLILKKKLKIIDFGGGLGNSYIDLIKKLNFKNLSYTIFDYERVIKETKKILLNNNKVNTKYLRFETKLENLSNCDILHFGNCLEHIEDFNDIFSKVLKKTRPKIIIISAFYVGSKNNYSTVGKYYGKKFILHFKSWKYFNKIIVKLGYNIVYKTKFLPKIKKKWTFYDMSNLPSSSRIKYTWNLILERI